ncbi:MAG: hypothetical protein ACK53Y_21990, partial [bacterium]
IGRCRGVALGGRGSSRVEQPRDRSPGREDPAQKRNTGLGARGGDGIVRQIRSSRECRLPQRSDSPQAKRVPRDARRHTCAMEISLPFPVSAIDPAA